MFVFKRILMNIIKQGAKSSINADLGSSIFASSITDAKHYKISSIRNKNEIESCLHIKNFQGFTIGNNDFAMLYRDSIDVPSNIAKATVVPITIMGARSCFKSSQDQD